jgi:RNA polymerase sigma factor (sigma-70 family)
MSAEPVRATAGRLSSEAAGARLGELFEEHGRMVYGLCRLLLRDPHEAEDAAQQVFLSAHRSMLAGTEPRDPGSWLGTIARNECFARIRARMTTPLTLVDEREPATADVEHLAAQRAEIEILCAALAELPQRQRHAVVLREFYGLSYQEVQNALGVTESAVESLLFRARKRLQEELRPARIASGVLALPLALRDTIAGAVPGFASGSGGGMLAKLASLPFAAKLVATAATVTAAGSIGYTELESRDHVPTASLRKPAIHGARRHPEKLLAQLVRSPSGSGVSAGEGEQANRGEVDDRRRENQGDDGASRSAEVDEGSSGSGDSGSSGDSGGSDEPEGSSESSDSSGSGSGDSGEPG